MDIITQDLLSGEHNSQDDIELERAAMMKFVEDRSNEILGYNNELAHLQTKLEEVKGRVMKWSVRKTYYSRTYLRIVSSIKKLSLGAHRCYYSGIS